MPEVWMVNRDRFVGDWEVDDSDPVQFDISSRKAVDELTEDWMPRSLRRIPGHPGFYFASVRGQPGDVAVVHENEDDGEFDVVGGYVEETLWLSRGVRGRGLAPEIVLEAAERRGGSLEPVSYTTAGKSAHAAAHRLAVARAAAAGHRIPPSVLADYPDIAEAVKTGVFERQEEEPAGPAPGFR
jgi:hypothetical protein